MKKFLKKLNRGAILTSVVIIAVIIYLVTTSAIHAREKPIIKEICQNYVEQEIKYSVLPEPYRSNSEIMPETEAEDFISQMMEKISPYYIDNERIRTLATDRIKSTILSQTEGWYRIKEYEKQISKFESFSFSGNEVTVVFNTQSVVERKADTGSASGDSRIVNQTQDTMVLQKSNGTWKVVYASLHEPYESNYATF